MQYIEHREVTITTPSFEMDGIISGTIDSFTFSSTNSHFFYWFNSGEINSLSIDKKNMKREQIEILESCEKKMKELLQ